MESSKGWELARAVMNNGSAKVEQLLASSVSPNIHIADPDYEAWQTLSHACDIIDPPLYTPVEPDDPPLNVHPILEYALRKRRTVVAALLAWHGARSESNALRAWRTRCRQMLAIERSDAGGWHSAHDSATEIEIDVIIFGLLRTLSASWSRRRHQELVSAFNKCDFL